MPMDLISQLGKLQDLALWGSWASIAGLAGVLYNTRKLANLSRRIDREHEKIVDTIRPFDLYCKIQEAIKVLPRHPLPRTATVEDRSTREKILDGLNASTECLRLYFREVHGLAVQRDNIFLDVAHAYLNKNNQERAMEYYKKALSRAKASREEDDRIECLYGLRSYFALQGNYSVCAVIDQALARVHSRSVRLDLGEQARGAVTMVVIRVRVALRRLFRLGSWAQRVPLPGTWPFLHGELRDLLECGAEDVAAAGQKAVPNVDQSL